MSGAPVRAGQQPWTRPSLERSGPTRKAGGFYRTAEGAGRDVGGVPLNTAEDAVVAAVRLAYKVADAQIARSSNLAQRLSAAGDRAAGEQSGRKALDATEQMVFRAIMSALAWLEAAAPGTAPENPIKRLLTAEYHLLGSLFGLRAPPRPPAAPAEPDAGTVAATARSSAAPAQRTTVLLRGDHKRPVIVRRLQLEADGPIGPETVTFYSAQAVERDPIPGSLRADQQGRIELSVTTPPNAPTGLWKAAICMGDVQIGLVEIEL